MKTNLYPLAAERKRCFIRITEFSFVTGPVRINHVFGRFANGRPRALEIASSAGKPAAKNFSTD